jgi:hypothetical protein
MTEKLVSLIELKEITAQLQFRLGTKISMINPNRFQDEMQQQLQMLIVNYQYKSNKKYTVEEHNAKAGFFHNYRNQNYNTIAHQRIEELMSEIDNEVSPENFKEYFDKIIPFLSHGNHTIREKAIQLIKNKNLLETLNYLINNVLNNDIASVKAISTLSINTEDWEKHLIHEDNWSPLVTALKKVAQVDTHLSEEDIWKNNSLYFMNVVANFSYFIPQEMAELENEIIFYLDLEKFDSRDFEIALYNLTNVYTTLKPYFSPKSIRKIRTIINQVGKESYAPGDVWVSQNLFPALFTIGTGDAECEATIKWLKAEYEPEFNDETLEDLIKTREEYIQNHKPDDNKITYYETIKLLIKNHTKLAVAELEQDHFQETFDCLEKATNYTDILYKTGKELETNWIDYFFENLENLEKEVEDKPFLKKIKQLHKRFTDI